MNRLLDSIVLHKSSPQQYMLIATFKYVGNDWDEDMNKMTANAKVREWWKMTDEMQISPVEGATGSADGPWWMKLEEVFYFE